MHFYLNMVIPCFIFLERGEQKRGEKTGKKRQKATCYIRAGTGNYRIKLSSEMGGNSGGLHFQELASRAWLFTNTEAGKDMAEQIISAKFTGNFPQGSLGSV